MVDETMLFVVEFNRKKYRYKLLQNIFFRSEDLHKNWDFFAIVPCTRTQLHVQESIYHWLDIYDTIIYTDDVKMQ